MMCLSSITRMSHNRAKSLMYIVFWVGLVSTMYVVNDVYAELNRFVGTERKIARRRLQKGYELVYLIGYPNTGTDAIMHILEEITGKSMATNNGEIISTKDGSLHQGVYTSHSIDESTFPNGPYFRNNDLPSDIPTMIVETMCSGHCFKCPNKDKFGSMNNYQSWAQACRTAQKYDVTTKSVSVMEPYKLDQRLSRAVVTVRNPLAVIVSSFNTVASGENKYYKENGLVNRQGLLEWCKKMDEIAMQSDSFKRILSEKGIPKDLKERIPCFSEFVRLTAWYNNFNKFAMGMEVHVTHYESLIKKLGKEVGKIVAFAELPTLMEADEVFFKPTGHKYAWFVDQDVALIRQLMHRVADFETWVLFEGYFSAFQPKTKIS